MQTQVAWQLHFWEQRRAPDSLSYIKYASHYYDSLTYVATDKWRTQALQLECWRYRFVGRIRKKQFDSPVSYLQSATVIK